MRSPVALGTEVRDAAVGGYHRVLQLWRRSLRVRIVATTLVLSMVVVALLGTVLLHRITDGLLDAKRDTALAEASSGFAEAQSLVAASDRTQTDAAAQLVDQIAVGLAARAGTPGLYDVLLLSSPNTTGTTTPVPERGSNLVDESSVPADLRSAVDGREQQAWTYTTINYTDGSSTPGLVVGAPLNVTGVGSYEIYYLFPLTQEESTLALVTRAIVLTGIALVLLLGVIAWLVTRQVVIPVRMAARIAEDFAAGRLEERMRVRGEDDFARLASAFNSMATNLKRQIRQLEDLSRVQRRFVSDVSHELRTPLTTIRMAADLIHDARAELDPAASRAAELLAEQLDRFEELLSDLLEISRFDAGAAVLDTEITDLRLLVERVVDATRPLADIKQVRIDLDLPERPCTAQVDPRRIERVLRNLVVNAVEHADGRPVVVRVARDQLAAAVTVRDHGLGLRPGESALVFNRFWRADPARARTTGGTGLGLAIALEDARLHGGWLEAWGAPGDGSQFRLTVPVEAGDDIAASPLPLRPEDADDRRLVPLSIGAPYRGGSVPASGPAPASAGDQDATDGPGRSRPGDDVEARS